MTQTTTQTAQKALAATETAAAPDTNLSQVSSSIRTSPIFSPKEAASLAPLPEGVFYARLNEAMLTDKLCYAHDRESQHRLTLCDYNKETLLSDYINAENGISVAILAVRKGSENYEQLTSALKNGTLDELRINSHIEQGQIEVLGMAYGSAERGSTVDKMATLSKVLVTKKLDEFLSRKAEGEYATLPLFPQERIVYRRADTNGRLEGILTIPEARSGALGFGVGKALGEAFEAEFISLPYTQKYAHQRSDPKQQIYSEVTATKPEAIMRAMANGSVIKYLEFYLEEQQDGKEVPHYYLVALKNAGKLAPQFDANASALYQLEKVFREIGKRMEADHAAGKLTTEELAHEREELRNLILPKELVELAKKKGYLPADFSYKTRTARAMELDAEDKDVVAAYTGGKK